MAGTGEPDLAHSNTLKHRTLRWLTPTTTALALALAATACSRGDGAGEGGASSSSSAPSVAEGRAVLTRYVEALNSGNVGEAMAVRCEAARIKAESMTIFAEQAKSLLAALGPITLDSVRKADPPSGLRPVAFVAERTELSYRVVVKGAPSRRDLRTVVIREKGEPRLCGFATGAAKQLHDELPDQLEDTGATAKDLVELMPENLGAAYRQTVDAAGTPTRPDMTRSWTRGWEAGDVVVSVTAAKYTVTPSASRDAAALAKAVASDGVEQFRVSGAPKALGVRYLGYAWLWLQPPAQAPFIDQIVIRFGDKVVITTVANAPGGTHAEINRVVGDIVKRARG